MEVRSHPTPLPEAGAPVELVAPGHGPVTAVVVGADEDGLGLTERPGDPTTLPAPGTRMTMSFVRREVRWELPVQLVAAPEGAPVRTAARPLGTARPSRRRAVRVRARLELGPGGETLAAATRNLSVNGALLALSRHVPVGGRVVLALATDDGAMALGGTVVRCDPRPAADPPWQVALAFDDLEPEVGDRLRRFLLRGDT